MISGEARAYKRAVGKISIVLGIKPKTERISLTVLAYPPDKRKRDLDNLLKIAIDSLQDANFFLNDEQIDHITIRRMEKVKGGKLLVLIHEFC